MRSTEQVYLPTGDPATSVETTQFREELGQTYTDHRGRWRKVKMESVSTVALAAKIPLYWKDRGAWEVTGDVGDGEANRNSPAGIIHADATVPAVGQHFWMLESGDNATAHGDANFAAGGVIIGSATSGRVSVVALGTAPTHKSFGTVHTAVDRSVTPGDVVINLAVDNSAI